MTILTINSSHTSLPSPLLEGLTYHSTCEKPAEGNVSPTLSAVTVSTSGSVPRTERTTHSLSLETNVRKPIVDTVVSPLEGEADKVKEKVCNIAGFAVSTRH